MTGRTLAVALLLLGASPAARAYRIVTRTAGTLEATSVVFVGQEARVAQASSPPRVIPFDDIDFYETFASNAGAGTGNLVVFQTGSLLRYDTIEMKSGTVRLGLGGTGYFVVPEALVDFRASVVEGALVNLPVTSGAVAVSRPAAGGGGGYEPDAGDEEPQAASPRSRRSRSAAGTRRGRDTPVDASLVAEQAAADLAASDLAAAEQAAARDAVAEETMSRRDAIGSPMPLTPEGSGGGKGDSPGGPVSVPVEQGERIGVQVVVTTDYGEDLAGLSLDVLYPAQCTVTHPTSGPAFSGFAAGFTTAVNVGRGGNPSSPLRIGGYAPPNTKASGPGEFLRASFQCAGSPDLQGFRVIGATAHDEHGNTIPAFTAERTDLSAQPL